MSSKGKSSAATGGGAALVPEWRFPEFQQAGAWESVALGSVASISTKKVRDKTCVPMSITSGVGLVSQMKKFGRIIAGDSYKNYLQLQKNDFAYNKSATKEYPEGFIALYTGEELAAVPNSIFTCFHVNEKAISPSYLNYLLLGNLHGRWLRKFIEVGARAHGSLSINDRDLLALPVPVPSGPNSLKEQQKIADCLTSVDALIAAQARKVEALKTHKKGLMQQLFPRPERTENGEKIPAETQPRLRFPEYEGAGEWEERPFSSIVDLISGVHLSPDEYGEDGEIPYFSGPSDFTDEVSNAKKWTASTKNAAKSGDTLITVKGSGVGEVWFSNLPSVALGRQLMAARPKKGQISHFVFQFLLTKKHRFEVLGAGNLIPGISRPDILDLRAFLPPPSEQQRIADCLTSVDDLIAAQNQKLATLKTHKKGLMQQLFPIVEGTDA